MFPLLIALAILPGILICFYIYKRDKYEKEPRMYLIISFVLGMISTLPAIGLESFAQQFESDTELLPTLLFVFIGIALVEESVKFLILRYYVFSNPVFNEPLDGIVYAVMIGMGFATLENILYSGSYGMGTTLFRAFSAVPAHGVFAITMGYYAGIAKFNPSYQKRIYLLLQGLLFATTLHGLYDFFIIQKIYSGLIIVSIPVLYISIYYSLKLIRMHQNSSPFIPAAQSSPETPTAQKPTDSYLNAETNQEHSTFADEVIEEMKNVGPTPPAAGKADVKPDDLV